MADEERPSTTTVPLPRFFSPTARHSQTFVRQVSATFTGGATLLPTTEQAADAELSARTPLLRQGSTRRALTQEQVQQRLLQEFGTFLQDHIGSIICAIVFCLVLFFVMSVVFFRAAYAAAFYFDKPCDQPLRYYLLVVILWGQVPQMVFKIVQRMWELTLTWIFILSIGLGIPGWCIIGWGLHMVHKSKTCHKTNPDLYWPTTQYIYLQILMTGLYFIGFVLVVIGGRALVPRILPFINSFIRQPGCEGAVHKLDKVDKDSTELIDPDDNQVMDCNICMESLGSEEQTVVRTKCAHYYHEDCLATWCKAHVDCPLCRQQIGEIDTDQDYDSMGSNV